MILTNHLAQMGPYKAPSLYGYGACFYQDHWSVVGKEVCHVVLSFLNSNADIEDINFTYLVLIPKAKNPKKVTQYGPISLCNVLYKIITNILTNRLKLILPSLI